MPIIHAPATQPPLPTAQNLVPTGQRVLPVEPARRVTPNKGSGKTELDTEKRRRRDANRGGTLDLEG
jgi:hypothetical protein